MTLGEFNEFTSRDALTLVDFYAVWCGPCRVMHTVLDKLAEATDESVDILKIDIDKHENVEVVRQHKIMAVPTLVLFRKGRILWRVTTRWRSSDSPPCGAAENRCDCMSSVYSMRQLISSVTYREANDCDAARSDSTVPIAVSRAASVS